MVRCSCIGKEDIMSRPGEIVAVKVLGKQIGYGNMMDIASALWSIEESHRSGVEVICQVPTVLPCIKKREVKRVKNQVRARVGEIEALIDLAEGR